jgi:Kef-type K+ transport system membrane component KefB
MVTKQQLIVTALAETAVGLMLLISPPLVVTFLLGVSLDAPAALVVARIAGAALLSLGCACGLARNDRPNRAVTGLVAAMLLYNSVAVAVLANAAAGARLVGVLTWPAVALHAALAVWCIACLWSGRRVWTRRHGPGV